MRNHFLIILMLLVGWITTQAQSSQLLFGMRAGATTYLPTGSLHSSFGSAIGGEIGYQWLSPIGRKAEIGLQVGAEAGYVRPGLRAKETINYSIADYLGHPMQYTINLNAQEQMGHLQLAFPIMLAFRFDHIQLHLGPRLAFPFFCQYQQRTQAEIMAFYPDYGVTVTNELITGKLLPEQEIMQGNITLSSVEVQAGVDLSYEWTLSSRLRYAHGLAIGAYCFCSLWNNSIEPIYAPKPIIAITPISTANDPAAKVSVLPISSAYSPHLLPIEAGARLTYSLGLQDHSSNKIKAPRYNKRKHKARILLY